MHKICEICKKAPATVHLTDIKNNVKKELHMCEECAAQKGINITKSLSLEQFFANPSALPGSPQVNPAQAAQKAKHAKIICDYCGLSWAEFREHGRLGCAHDYEAFRKGLEPLLEDVHTTRVHRTGKSPRHTPEQDQQRQRLDLQRRLREAVAQEDYKLAAQLRDQIAAFDLAAAEHN